MKIFIIVGLIFHLIFGILSTRLLMKYYKQNDWDFDNYDTIMIICCFLFGLAGYIAILITNGEIEDYDYGNWKITKWFNKKIKE